MKFLKGIVSLVLCIAIMATTAVFAFAESDPNLQPVITQQPRDVSLKVDGFIPHPTGMEATIETDGLKKVGYELYYVQKKDKLVWNSDDTEVNCSLKSGEYYFVAYNYFHPEYRVKSDTFKVEVQKETLKEKFDRYVWNLSFVFALFFSSLRATIISIFR